MSQAPPCLSRALAFHSILALLLAGTGLGLVVLGSRSVQAQTPQAGTELTRPNSTDSAPTTALVPPSPANSQPQQIVADVRIVGNSYTKDFLIFEKIKTRKNLEFDPELVQKDVRTLYATGRFRDVIPHTKQTKDGMVVTYELIERPHIRYIVYHGNHGMSEKKLSKEHGLKVGDALNAFSVQEGRRKIEELYHASGFPKAAVMIVEGEGPKDKGVFYEIHEGPLARIAHVDFMGNTVASSKRLETFIQSTPGYFSYASPYLSSKFDRQKLEQDVETLTKYYRRLGYFSARIGRELVADDSGKWVTVKFIIDEGPRYKIRNITIEGSTKFEGDKLLGFLKLKRGEHFNQDFMERDRVLLVDLYGTQGHAFADIQADPRLLEEPGQLDLVYRITEGAVFHVGNINVHIAGDFPHTKESVVLNRLSIRHGDLVDSREIRNSERRLKASNLFITNPQEGDPPRIVVREPTFTGVEGLADSPPRGSAIRGQSPEPVGEAERIAQEQFEHEARKCIYTWNGPRPHEPALRPTQSYVPKR